MSTEGLDIVSVRVHGDCIGPELATLSASGGHFGNEKDEKYLIWLNEQEIVEGDAVEIAFHEKTDTSDPGQTIQDLYPNETSQFRPDQSIEKTISELALMPRIRKHFLFHVETSMDETIHAQTGTNEHSFGFSVVWHWRRPDVAKVSLTSNSLEGIRNRKDGSEHARFRLRYGQRTRLTVSA